MANRDGTGPEGKGALTGRGLGDCSTEQISNNEPKTEGLTSRGQGVGRGRGRGFGPGDGTGRGFGRGR
jgi:hypothetical protein